MVLNITKCELTLTQHCRHCMAFLICSFCLSWHPEKSRVASRLGGKGRGQGEAGSYGHTGVRDPGVLV